MISNVNQFGKYTEIRSITSMYASKNYSGSNLKMVGNMMYDFDAQHLKVYDGTNWITLTGGSTAVGLSNEAESLLDWAKTKRNEEERIKQLAAKYPSVADALKTVEQAEQQLRVVTALVQE